MAKSFNMQVCSNETNTHTVPSSIYDPLFENELLYLLQRVAKSLQGELGVNIATIENVLAKFVQRPGIEGSTGSKDSKDSKDEALQEIDNLEMISVNGTDYLYHYETEYVYTYEKMPKRIGTIHQLVV